MARAGNRRESSRAAASPNRSSSPAAPACSSSAAPPGRSSATAPGRPADLICTSLEKLRQAGSVSIPYAPPEEHVIVEIKELQALCDVPEALELVNRRAEDYGWILVNRVEVEIVAEYARSLRRRRDRLRNLIVSIQLARTPAPECNPVEESLGAARARIFCKFPSARSLADASAARAARAEACTPAGASDADGGSSSDEDGGSSSDDDDENGGAILEPVAALEFANAYADEAFTNANADSLEAFTIAARDHVIMARRVFRNSATNVLDKTSTLLGPRKPPSLREAWVLEETGRDLAARSSARGVAMVATINRFLDQADSKLLEHVVIAQTYAALG